MRISIIIVSYKVQHFLHLCLSSVQRAMDGIPGEIIVVDNASGDGSADMVAAHFPDVVLLRNSENTGFSKANNQAYNIAQGEYILFLNPDTVMPEDFLQKALAYLDTYPSAGALGPRLIDGYGRFAPDGKKGFPTLSVALYKSFGFGKIFPRSPRFNKYYAAHIQERQIAPVEVLSGCCMLVRRAALEKAGGAFDESYFMYCEDVDLSYRITQAGFENIYYPDITLLHYKGESTRKATVSYVRIFNEALATFVRKHYQSSTRRMYLFLLQVGIFFRAVLAVSRNIIKALRLPIADALMLFLVLFLLQDLWVEKVKNQQPVPWRDLLVTHPVYVLLWVGALFVSGGYDRPYRPLRVVRGMAVGTVVALAYFGLLPAELRHSRGVVLLSGITGTVALLALHEALHALGIYRLNRTEEQARNAVVVALPAAYDNAVLDLRQSGGAPNILGRIAPEEAGVPDALAPLDELPGYLKAALVDEVIFCAESLSYQHILDTMQRCGPAYYYRIQAAGAGSFVGDGGSLTAGHSARQYRIATFAQQRNKRILDLAVAATFLLLSPVLFFYVKNGWGFLQNIFRVLSGRRTWIGWPKEEALYGALPRIRSGIAPPWQVLPDYPLAGPAARQAAEDFARNYTAGRDLRLIRVNLRWLGSK